MLIRCIVRFEFKKYFIGRTYSAKWLLIERNEHSNHFKKGGDYDFYCKKKKSFLIDNYIPISNEEAFETEIGM